MRRIFSSVTSGFKTDYELKQVEELYPSFPIRFFNIHSTIKLYSLLHAVLFNSKIRCFV